MRTAVHLGVVAVALLTPAGVRAGDRETALVAQAITAHGGEAALTKAQTVVRNGAGALKFGDSEVAFVDEITFALPGRFKQTVKLEKSGQVLIVLNADRGWRSAGGAVNELGKEGVEPLQEEVYVEWLTTLVPLKKDTFTLTPVEDRMVDGKPAAGVKAASKGHGDVRLYFDKASGLLVKVERQSKEAGFAVNKEYLYAGHKEFDGVKLPTKRTELLNGKKFVDLTSMSYRFPGKVDDATFAKP